MVQGMRKAEQKRQTQSGPKHSTKSSDLRRRLKRGKKTEEQWLTVIHLQNHTLAR